MHLPVPHSERCRDNASARSILIPLAVCLVVLSTFFTVSLYEKLTLSTKTIPVTGNVGEITSETVVEQTFTCGDYGLEQTCVNLETYGRTNHGTLTVDLYDEGSTSDEPVQTWNVDVSTLRNEIYRTFEVGERIYDGAQHEYRLVFTSDSEAGDAVSIDTGAAVEGDKLTINGVEANSTICRQLSCRTSIRTFFSDAINLRHTLLYLTVTAATFAALTFALLKRGATPEPPATSKGQTVTEAPTAQKAPGVVAIFLIAWVGLSLMYAVVDPPFRA